MKRKRRNFPLVLLFLLLSGSLITGCSSSIGRASEPTFESSFNDPQEKVSTVGSYDSADTAVIKGVDTEEGYVTFVNIETGKTYTLSYDGTTVMRDKYEGILSAAQVKAGEIADITFLKGSKKLVSLTLSKEAFSYEAIDKYSIDTLKGNAVIGENTYQIREGVLVYSEGEVGELSDIVNKDVITVKGLGHNIFSISVDRGHGYLRLENDAYAIGGWIEVGQALIQQVTDNMLLTVPEGTYNVRITGKGVDVVNTVTIDRNQETTIDLGHVEVEEVKKGKLFFTVEPENGEVFIDGEKADISKPVELDYGLHQIMAKAKGYSTLTQYIKVSQDIASVQITMEEEREETEDDSDRTGTVSGNELNTGGYKVYVDSPSGAEVYLNGVYKGIAPVSFPKVAGTYTLSLRRKGYITKSYTIQVDDTAGDVTYSFSALDPDRSTVSGNNTVSSNSNKPKDSENNNSNKPKDPVSGNSTVSGNN